MVVGCLLSAEYIDKLIRQATVYALLELIVLSTSRRSNLCSTKPNNWFMILHQQSSFHNYSPTAENLLQPHQLGLHEIDWVICIAILILGINTCLLLQVNYLSCIKKNTNVALDSPIQMSIWLHNVEILVPCILSLMLVFGYSFAKI